MSEASRGLVTSAEHNKVGPNYFGFYANEVAELLLQDEDFLPFSSQNSELSEEVRDGDMTEHGNKGIKSDRFASSSRLFSDGIGTGLSDFRRERLKGLLRQSVIILTREVDEMLDPVVAMRRLRYNLRGKNHISSYSGAASDGDAGRFSSKKLKRSSSSSSIGISVHASPGSGSERMNSKLTLPEKGDSNVDKRTCARCRTMKTPMWRRGPDGRFLCNACGIKLKKERESLLTKNEERESLLGSRIEAGEKNEVSDDLQFLLENDSLQVEEKMKKYFDELSATLGNMEQQLEELLDTISAKCRPMTLTEKQKLLNLIQSLPPRNLDRVVEIIRHGKMSKTHSHDEIYVDLEEEDNSTLWRLYYYVKAVENARKLSMSLNQNTVLV